MKLGIGFLGFLGALALSGVALAHPPSVRSMRNIAVSDKSGDLQWVTLAHGDRREKTIALTFDDGPHPGRTLELLDLLDRLKVKATFFVVGKMAEQRPFLVREEMRRGHLVANHSYSHPDLSKLSLVDAEKELRECSDTIERITGLRPSYCRPPGGEMDSDVLRAAMAEDLTTVLWTDDPGDYASPGSDVILQRTLAAAKPGGIILLHDGIDQTLAVLPQIILTLERQGYRFVTVDQLEGQVQAVNARLVAASRKVSPR